MAELFEGWFPRVMVVTAASQLLIFALRPVLSYQALALAATQADLAVVVASFSVLSLVVSIPIGRGMDRRGERGFMLAGGWLLVAGVLPLPFAGDVWVLVVSSAALGLGQTLTMIACQTIIGNGRDLPLREKRFANFTLATSGAQFAAPAIAGLLIIGDGSGSAKELDLRGVYALAAVTAFVCLMTTMSLSRRPAALALRQPPTGVAVPGALREVMSVRSVNVALVVGFTVLSAADLLVAFMPVYGHAAGLTPQLVGLLIAAHGLASVLVRLRLTWLLAQFARSTILCACLGFAAACLALVPFVTSVPGLFVLMLGSGAGIGLCQPIAISWVAASVRPEVRATAMSARMAGNRLGQTVVPLGVASAAGAVGVSAAFVGPAAMLVGAGVMVATVGRTSATPQ